MSYSQNQEEKYIVEHFEHILKSITPPRWILEGRSPTLLDIGANDGRTFSNSLKLIELGWDAVLIEPSPIAFSKLALLHGYNSNVRLLNLAIGSEDKLVTLFESAHHLPDKSDYALLSTIEESEKARWNKTVEFTELDVPCITYKTLTEQLKNRIFDFITIDSEGLDLIILKQIDLTKTELLCIEYNSIGSVKQEILSYCEQYGINNVIYQNAENLLIAR